MAPPPSTPKNPNHLCSVTLLLVLLLWPAMSESEFESKFIEYLPGFSGKLPFKLETGYVSVGELDDLQIFYYFIESQRNPVKDPLLLWHTGGPGCSGFSGLVYEIGPLIFDYATFNGSSPTFLRNGYSWTEVANIIFLDSPVGTGFSYSKSQEGYYSSDTKSAEDSYQFLRKWLVNHPKFLYNPLYVAGDSYSGMIVPQVTKKIADGNAAKLYPIMKLQGYILGNPVTDLHDDQNSRYKYYHRLSIISDELYETAKTSCQNEFIYPNVSNSECIESLQEIEQCTEKVNDAHILEPKCSFALPKPDALKLYKTSGERLRWGQSLPDDPPLDILLFSSQSRKEKWCRNNNYVLSYIWANSEQVQAALGVRNGTVSDWKRCNKTLAYDENLDQVVNFHYELSREGFRALIYSGDHDVMIPYTGTLYWINTLNLTTSDDWRPWFVNGQVAGFTMKFAVLGIGDGLTYTTVKDGGHTAPEYQPEQCLEMIDRWLSYYAL